MLIGRYQQATPPRWPFAAAQGSPHLRGAVLVAPMLHGMPPMDLVQREVFAWSGTAPSSTVPAAVEGMGPLDALTVDGNGFGYVDTGRTYGVQAPSALTVEWWMSEDGNYLSADGFRYIASNRTAGNAGWSVGRESAVSGPPGNATTPTLIIQGVGVYSSSTFAIAARGWRHVAVTLSGTALTMYVDGVSVHTATTGSMTTGGDLVLMSLGPAGTGSAWMNDVHSLIVRNVALTAGEVALRADPEATWGAYEEYARRTWFLPAAAAPETPGTLPAYLRELYVGQAA